jgi:hypothetical protein
VSISLLVLGLGLAAHAAAAAPTDQQRDGDAAPVGAVAAPQAAPEPAHRPRGFPRRSESGADHEQARQLRERGEILPLASVVDRYAGSGGMRILDVELEAIAGGYVYQVEFLDGSGILQELRVDARTGESLRSGRRQRH